MSCYTVNSVATTAVTHAYSVSLTPGSHFGAGFKWGNSIEMEEVFLMIKYVT